MFLYLFLAFAVGIVLNEQLRPSVWLGFCGVLGCLGVAIWRRIFWGALLGAVIFSGMLYCRAVCFLPSGHILHVSKYIDWKTSSFIGVVKGDIKHVQSLGRYQTFQFSLHKVLGEGGYNRDVSGVLQARIFHNIELAPGDRVLIQGTLHRPFEFKGKGRFSYKTYLRQRQIYFMITAGRRGVVEKIENEKGGASAFIRAREKMKKEFDRYLPEFEAGILKAVLLGDRTQVDRELRDVFSKTGTAHVLAISGLHMSMILLIFLFLLGFLPVNLKTRYTLAIILLVLYIPIAGGRVSVLRSGIMAVVFLYSFIAERKMCSLNALGLAGLIILIINPLDLFAVGFRLSFSAVFSLIVFYAPVFEFIQKLFPNSWKFLIQSFSASFTAWLGIVGWAAFYFELLAPIGLLANVGVVCIMSLVIAMGLMLAVFAVLGLHWLSTIAAMNVVFLVRFLAYFVSVLAQIPFGCFTEIRVSAGGCAFYYLALLGTAFVLKIRKPSVSRGFS